MDSIKFLLKSKLLSYLFYQNYKFNDNKLHCWVIQAKAQWSINYLELPDEKIISELSIKPKFIHNDFSNFIPGKTPVFYSGPYWDNEEVSIIVADEISPDNCRLWDVKTNKKLDKDRFRQDLGEVGKAYKEVAYRLGVLSENEFKKVIKNDL